jgi:hypothetical protein
MQVAALTSAAVDLGAAALIAVVLRRTRIRTERKEGSEPAAAEASEMAQL